MRRKPVLCGGRYGLELERIVAEELRMRSHL